MGRQGTRQSRRRIIREISHVVGFDSSQGVPGTLHLLLLLIKRVFCTTPVFVWSLCVFLKGTPPTRTGVRVSRAGAVRATLRPVLGRQRAMARVPHVRVPLAATVLGAPAHRVRAVRRTRPVRAQGMRLSGLPDRGLSQGLGLRDVRTHAAHAHARAPVLRRARRASPLTASRSYLDAVAFFLYFSEFS